MSKYDVGSDPYLSDEFKSRLSKLKADGVDLSFVDRFLAETAPLVAPLPRPRIWPPLAAAVAIVSSICGLVWLCIMFP